MRSGWDMRAYAFVAMRTVKRIMIDIIGPAYRESRGEVRRTGLFCESAENLVVKLLKISIAGRETVGRG